MNKPLVYNYKTAEEKIEGLTERIRELNNENAMLKKRIEGLKDSNATLRNACRIAEADGPNVAYLCDRRACESMCSWPGCVHTTQIEHARNFTQTESGNYYEDENTVGIYEVAKIVEEILEIVKRLEG